MSGFKRRNPTPLRAGVKAGTKWVRPGRVSLFAPPESESVTRSSFASQNAGAMNLGVLKSSGVAAAHRAALRECNGPPLCEAQQVGMTAGAGVAAPERRVAL